MGVSVRRVGGGGPRSGWCPHKGIYIHSSSCRSVVGRGGGGWDWTPDRQHPDHKSVGRVLREFTGKSTLHGIAHAAAARTRLGRLFWASLFVVCISLLSFQLTKTTLRFLKYEKIVQVELRFAAASFPAITLCNLNPYKRSAVAEVADVQRTLDVFYRAVVGGGGPLEAAGGEEQRRAKRQSGEGGSSGGTHFAGVLRDCLCAEEESAENLEACASHRNMSLLRATHPARANKTCICWTDLRHSSYHPCFPQSSWQRMDCSDCQPGGNCRKGGVEAVAPGSEARNPCLCHVSFGQCVLEGNVTVPDTPTSTTTSTSTTSSSTTSSTSSTSTSTTQTTTSTSTSTSTTTTTPTTTTLEPELVEALGFEGLTDEVAIAAKGKENMVFAVAELSNHQKAEISYTKDELIKKCSFNGKQCDIERDFVRHVDPTFGNCFTFNHDGLGELWTTRAGATYGLRVLLYSNTSDYLPTTEEVGVRIAIHQKSQVPFPDTLGYSAPTGLLSSFGIRLRRFQRLPEPYGSCVDPSPDHHPEGFIFRQSDYSVEGCHRSCFQRKLIKACGCGDPRFPRPGNGSACAASDAGARACLERETELLDEAGGGGLGDCLCRQPCQEDVYDVVFSASKWPSGHAQVAECEEADKACIERYRDNAAMIQVYYEQLGYESLTESEAYGFENLLADVGGQLGLWMGVSIISFMELLVLCYNLWQSWLRREELQKESTTSNGAFDPAVSLPCVCACGARCGTGGGSWAGGGWAGAVPFRSLGRPPAPHRGPKGRPSEAGLASNGHGRACGRDEESVLLAWPNRGAKTTSPSPDRPHR